MWWFKPRPISDHVSAVIRSLNEFPDEWSCGEFCAENTRTGLQIWTANGVEFCEFYRPIEVKLSRRDKKALWNAVVGLVTKRISALAKGT